MVVKNNELRKFALYLKQQVGTINYESTWLGLN